MGPIFARRGSFGNAHADADHLRLVGRQRHPARTERDHVERGPFGRTGFLLGNFVEAADRGHSFDFQADAIGRRLGADIVQHHLGPARSVEDDARRRNEQVTGGLRRQRGRAERHRKKQAEAFEKA